MPMKHVQHGSQLGAGPLLSVYSNKYDNRSKAKTKYFDSTASIDFY